MLTTLGSGIADLGIGTTLLRRGALAAGGADESGLLGAVRAGVTWTLLQAPWNIGLGFLVLPSWSAAELYAIGILLGTLFIGPAHYLLMTNQLRIPSLINVGSASLGLIVATIVASSTHRADLVFGVSAIAGNALACVLLIAIPRRLYRGTLVPGRMHLSRADITFGLGNFFNIQLNALVFSRVELLFFTSHQASARGRFAASQTIAARATIVLDAMIGNLSYGMTNALGKGPDAFRRSAALVTDTVGLILVATTPVSLAGIAVLAGPVFGRGYRGIAPAAVTLGIMSIWQSSLTPLLSLRFAQKQIRPLIIAGIVGALGDLLAAAILVRPFGLAGAVIASSLGAVGYIVTTTVLFRGDTAVGAIALPHMARVTMIVAYSAILGVALLLLPQGLALGLAAPLSITWSVIAFRLPPFRSRTASAFDALRDSLPGPLSRLLGSRAARWVLAQPR